MSLLKKEVFDESDEFCQSDHLKIYISLSVNQRKTANLFFYQIARKNIKFFANEFAEKKKEVFTQIDRNYFLCQSEVSKKKIFLGNQIAQKNAVFLPIR